MAKDINGVPILDLYKINRASVEHFDRILGTFRQIIFAVNGAIVTACIAKITDAKLLFGIGILLAGINLLVWQLEKHYHRYLMVSAKIAEKMERAMFEDGDRNKYMENMLYAITYQFREAKHKRVEDGRLPKWFWQIMYHFSRYVRTCDLLYICPVLLVVVVNFIISMRLGGWWIVGWWVSSGIFIAMGYTIIRYSYWFDRRYKGTKCFDDFASCVWDGDVYKNKRLKE